MQVGAWHVTALSDGWLRLDGGAMWGVVPAVMWRPMTPADEENRILMALRPFLLERDGALVIVEPGVGDRWSEKLIGIYALDRRDPLHEALAACGRDASEVTHVVASHAHWDHFGAAVVERDGELVPRFPNARYFLPQPEIEMALDPGALRKASYRADDVRPLIEAGVLEGFDGEQELLPGLTAHVLGGHSDGASVLTLAENDGQVAGIFWGDVAPTTHHVQPPYIMAYDIDASRSYEVRSEWLAKAARGEWIGLFYHDPDVAFARLTREGKRYLVHDLVPAGERE